MISHPTIAHAATMKMTQQQSCSLYVVQSGDSLSVIAQRLASNWHTLYNQNLSIIEQTAHNHGLANSYSGAFIFIGEGLVYCVGGGANKSSGTSSGTRTVQQDILTVFGQGWLGQQALIIAGCESGFNPGAWSPIAVNTTPGWHDQHAMGVFQFLPSTWRATPYAMNSPYDQWANINAAYWLRLHDGDWHEWSCRDRL
jgi:LysM domain/Transglycosylase SLT domain